MAPTLKERAVDALFVAGLRLNGTDRAAFRRGDAKRVVRGFFIDGATFAETSGRVFRSAETRAFVVERAALASLFPPRPRDVLELADESGGRRFEIFADDGAPPYSSWNRDRRYVVLNLLER